MLRGVHVSTAIALVLEHTSRSATGELEDPADVSAVVMVERLAEFLGTTDAVLLRQAVESVTSTWEVAPGAAPFVRDEDVSPLEHLVQDLVEVVSNAVAHRVTGVRPDAAVLNFEGGAHPVSQDATDLRVAARAACRSFEQEPYYRARYGVRGSRFAASDSSWLVTLATHKVETALHHVTWLAGLLAARGMPTWLMEVHLEQLCEELRAEGRQVGALPVVLTQMRWARRRHVSDELLQQAEEWVVAELEEPVVEGIGRLVAAGCADVAQGITEHDSALVDWFTDPVRTREVDARALLGVRERVLQQVATRV